MWLRLLRALRQIPPRSFRRSAKTRGHRLARQIESLEPRVVLSLQGWQLFPADSAWNQNISNAPVAANSAAIISHIGSSIALHPDWGDDNPANGDSPLYGIPINIVHGNSTPTVSVVIDNYPDESDIEPVPIPANAVLEGDYQNGPNLNGGGYGENGNPNQRGDSHLIVFDEDNDIAYELYGVSRPNDPTLFPNNDDVELTKTDTAWHAAQETVWNMKTDEFRTLGATSADAAGLSILAGLARPDEGLPVSQGGQGAIDHALRLTLPSQDVLPQYTYPASHMVNESLGSTKLPLGARLRLQNTPAVNKIINAMPAESQIVAHAMQQYGLILADIGSPMYVTGTSAIIDNVDSPNTDLVWNTDGDIFANNGLKTLTAGDFDVVSLTPQVTSISASKGAVGGTLTIKGLNFSGAAGRLSVFFGSTQVNPNSLTIVSDSQINVVIPAGAGSVHITVQSGINSGNSSANFTSPIFGYGVSTATSADLFTYINPPVASADSYTATAGTTLSVTAPGVLANDSDPQSLPLTAIVATGPVHGALSLASNGSFTYTPTAGYLGPDSFTYTASDGYASSGAVTVSLSVVSGTLTWAGGASGNWTDADWSGAGPPFPDRTTNVIVNTAANVNVSGSQAALSLSVSGSGQVDVAQGATLSVTSSVSITGGSVVGGTVQAAAFQISSGTVTANLTGGGGLTKSGSGTATLSGHNTYTGSTVVNAGALIVSGGALPIGTSLIIGGSAGAPATLTLAPTDAEGNSLSAGAAPPPTQAAVLLHAALAKRAAALKGAADSTQSAASSEITSPTTSPASNSAPIEHRSPVAEASTTPTANGAAVESLLRQFMICDLDLAANSPWRHHRGLMADDASSDR